jgi:hypothetical protein
MSRLRYFKGNINLWLTIGLLGVLVLLFMSYGARSVGTYYDDDIAHYLIARFSWKHPELFFNTWGRPVYTILYAPAALLGFGAVKAWSALLAGLTCLGGAYLARLYRVRWYWLAAIFIAFQPEFLRQSFSSLTELSFALVLCIALIAYKKQSWTVMALAVGFLPLARYESLLIVLMFAVILLQHRKPYLIMLMAAPLLVQNAFWAIKGQNITLLLFPFDQLLGLRASTSNLDYGTGDVLYYLRLLPVAYGGITFVFFCYGAIRQKLGILQLSVVFALGTLAVTYWLLPAAGVAGYIRHLAVVAPAVGVLAAIGLEGLFDHSVSRGQQILAFSLGALLAVWLWIRQIPSGCVAALTVMASTVVKPRHDMLVKLVKIGFVIGLAVSTLSLVQPFSSTLERQITARAADWFSGSKYTDRLVLASHTYFKYSADLDEFDPNVFLQITPQNIERAPLGSIIVWDSHYSHRLAWNTPLEMLQNQSRFRLLQSWDENNFQLYIYEKIGDK